MSESFRWKRNTKEWKTSVVVPIFKGKGDAKDCGAYRGVKLLEHEDSEGR